MDRPTLDVLAIQLRQVEQQLKAIREHIDAQRPHPYAMQRQTAMLSACETMVGFVHDVVLAEHTWQQKYRASVGAQAAKR